MPGCAWVCRRSLSRLRSRSRLECPPCPAAALVRKLLASISDTIHHPPPQSRTRPGGRNLFLKTDDPRQLQVCPEPQPGHQWGTGKFCFFREGAKALFFMVHPERFERPTPRFVVCETRAWLDASSLALQIQCYPAKPTIPDQNRPFFAGWALGSSKNDPNIVVAEIASACFYWRKMVGGTRFELVTPTMST